jgi:acetylornithine/succinyldiaminopimelate/putrescine aminotransferase
VVEAHESGIIRPFSEAKACFRPALRQTGGFSPHSAAEVTPEERCSVIPALMPTYNRADLAFERGEGAYVWTDAGRRFLDFGSGIATSSLGHGHPHLVKAIAEQAAKVMHVSNLYRVPLAEKLAARHVAASFADSVFFCNSGAEANEGRSRPCGNTTPRTATRKSSA